MYRLDMKYAEMNGTVLCYKNKVKVFDSEQKLNSFLSYFCFIRHVINYKICANGKKTYFMRTFAYNSLHEVSKKMFYNYFSNAREV